MTDTVQIATIVRRALQEDVGQGDVTSLWTLPPNLTGSGMFLCKAEGILAGMEVAREVFRQVSTEISIPCCMPTMILARSSLIHKNSWM